MDGLRRFQDDRVTDLAAALRALPDNARRVVVGFSGGRDSATLLHVCCQVFEPRRVLALHVCHGLETAAADWAAFCAERARAYGIAFKRFDVAVDVHAAGLEAGARAARYGAIGDWLNADDVLVTAHHAEDQAQTVLIQALRGAGVRGLAGMPVWRALGAGRHWRPWLTIAAADIAAHAETAGLAWVDDPSNHDPARDRGYLDAEIWPALLAGWPAAARMLSRVGERASEAREALDQLATIDLAAARVADDRLSIAVLVALSSPRRRETLLAWCRARGVSLPDPARLDEIERLLFCREHNSPRVRVADHDIRRFDGQLFLMAALGAPPDPATRLAWSGRSELVLPGDAGRLVVADEAVDDHELVVGFRRGGERLIRGDGHSQPLKDFCQQRRIPPWIRARLPLIYQGDRLVAVADRWIAPGLSDALAGVLARIGWQPGLTGD